MVPQPLGQPEIDQALQELTGWRHESDSLRKEFSFGSFPEALAFMVRVGFKAEAANHHPDWRNVYNRVMVSLSTHDAGNTVTGKDTALAREIEKIAWV